MRALGAGRFGTHREGPLAVLQDLIHTSNCSNPHGSLRSSRFGGLE
jgi:hypothetical protein